MIALLLVVNSTFGHSQMRCANYDRNTNTCKAPIRNSEVTFGEEANDMLNGGGVCNQPISNPISASYANGNACPSWAGCPLPMGSIVQGQNITVMWLARNHASADQTPGNVEIYLSPTMTDGSIETSTAVFGQNKFCVAPFASCDGLNGNMIQCYATCQMPANTQVGIHTIWWKWAWANPTVKSIYTTCADVWVTASGNQPAPTPTPTPAVTTTAAAPSTTGVKVQVTTAAPVSATTARPAAPVTTAAPAPVTTAAQAPVTTGRPVPSTTAQSTTGKSAPVTTAAPAPVTTAKVVPSSSSSTTGAAAPPKPTGACSLGNQICIGSNSYQTCTNGNVGNYWAAPQSCQPGLGCHPSTDGLNVYCY